MAWLAMWELSAVDYKTDREGRDIHDFGGKSYASIPSPHTPIKEMILTKSLFLTWLSAAAFSRAAEVHYDLDLTWQRGSPNGHEREMIFVNNRFPGPPLIVDEGDEVTVSPTLHLLPPIHVKKNRSM